MSARTFNAPGTSPGAVHTSGPIKSVPVEMAATGGFNVGDPVWRESDLRRGIKDPPRYYVTATQRADLSPGWIVIGTSGNREYDAGPASDFRHASAMSATALARAHMNRFGTTAEDLADVSFPSAARGFAVDVGVIGYFYANAPGGADYDYVEFKARFSGVARDISVPVNRIMAIYARETSQGMAFPNIPVVDSETSEVVHAEKVDQAPKVTAATRPALKIVK